VKQYIEDVTNQDIENQNKLRLKSKSCGNLSPYKPSLPHHRSFDFTGSKPFRPSTTLRLRPAASLTNLNDISGSHCLRPSSSKSVESLRQLQNQTKPWKTTDALDNSSLFQDHSCDISEPDNELTGFLMTEKNASQRSGRKEKGLSARNHSKSNPNLSQQGWNPNLSQQGWNPSLSQGFSKANLSKSTLSLGIQDFNLLVDPEDSDFETKIKYFSRENLNEVLIDTDDLIHMVYQERKGKQEAKRVLDELKSNYENLLKKICCGRKCFRRRQVRRSSTT